MLPILDPVHSSCSLRCSFTVDFSPTEQCLPASLIMVSLYVSSCILLLLFSILSSILLVSLVSMWFAVNCVLALRKSACLSWWQVCFHSYLFWSVAIWCFLFSAVSILKTLQPCLFFNTNISNTHIHCSRNTWSQKSDATASSTGTS